MARRKRSEGEIRARLTDLGVPPRVIEHVLREPLSFRAYMWPTLLLFVLMIGGFTAGAAFVWAPLERLTDSLAREHAVRIGGLLYEINFGLSLLLALFGWIFVCGWVAGLVAAHSSSSRTSSFVYGLLDAKPTALAMIRRGLALLRDETDPELYVRRFTGGWVRFAGAAAVVLMGLSAVLAVRDVQTHSIYTAEAYVPSPFLPWGSSEPRPWSSALRVELGCNHVTGRGAKDYVLYDVEFADGSSARIDNPDAVPVSGTWIEQMTVIDAAVRRSGARFERWDWLNRDPLNPDCLRYFQRTLPSGDYQQVRALLRADDEL